MKAADVTAKINERMIQALTQGEIPWVKPWTVNGPRNLFSGRPYTGINRVGLALTRRSLPFWATYRQYLAAGLQVRKGEHGEGIIYVSRGIKTEKEEGSTEEKKRSFSIFKAFVVFNVEQTDYEEKGFTLPEVTHEIQRIPACEDLITDYTEREGIMIATGDHAAYIPTSDSIVCPDARLFRSKEHRYAVLYHECIHSTGPRLGRFNRADPVKFGSGTYGREELVAEIGSAYLAALTGIDSKCVIENQTAYLQNWAKAIQADDGMIMYAAGKAEKAADFIIREPQEEETS